MTPSDQPSGVMDFELLLTEHQLRQADEHDYCTCGQEYAYASEERHRTHLAELLSAQRPALCSACGRDVPADLDLCTVCRTKLEDADREDREQLGQVSTTS